jgi:hypothetical protein
VSLPSLLLIQPLPSHSPYYILVPHLFASISAHTFSMRSLFSLASCLFCAVRSRRSPRRHMLTLYFASVQLPVTFQRKPRAWHSSRAATTSAQAVDGVLVGQVRMEVAGPTLLDFFGVEMGMHCNRVNLV